MCVKKVSGQVSMIEIREVSIKLISSLREKYSYSAGGMTNGGDPDLTIRRWAAHLYSTYDHANLPTTSRQETGIDANIVVGAVQGLGGRCRSPLLRRISIIAVSLSDANVPLSCLRALLSLSIWHSSDGDVSCAGTVSNLAEGISKMENELERVCGAEDLIRENERLRLQNRLRELRIKSLEDEYNVPVDKRFDAIQAPPTTHQDETPKTLM